jgi:hypothetical protein
MNLKNHTWNDHSLAAHDEDDLHWTELSHLHTPALDQGIAQLANKDTAVEPHGDRLCDMHSHDSSLIFSHAQVMHGLDVAENADGKAKPDSNTSK